MTDTYPPHIQWISHRADNTPCCSSCKEWRFPSVLCSLACTAALSLYRLSYVMLTLTLALSSLQANGQAPSYTIDYKTFNIPLDGFENQITAILEHSNHYLLIGHQRGVMRYNGNEFLPIDSSFHMGGKRIVNLVEERAGGVWALCGKPGERKLLKLDFEKGSSADAEQLLNWPEELAAKDIIRVFSDAKKDLWIRCPEAMYRWDGRHFSRLPLPAETRAYGGIWVYPTENPEENWFMYTAPFDDPLRGKLLWKTEGAKITHKSIIPIMRRVFTPEGHMGPPLYYSQDSLYRGDQESMPLDSFLELGLVPLGQLESVACWIAPGKPNTLRFTDSLGRNIAQTPLAGDLQAVRLRDSFHLGKNRLWIITDLKKIIGIELVPSIFQRILSNIPTSEGYYQTTGFFADETRHMLYASSLGKSYAFDMRSQRREVTGQINQAGSLREQGMPFTAGESILVAKDGCLWTAQGGNRLFKQGPSQQQGTFYTYLPGIADSLLPKQQYCLFEDSQRSLWVGHEKGLSQFNLQDSSLRLISLSSPLFQETPAIYSIYEWQGYLWLGSSQGLIQLSLSGEVVAVSNPSSQPLLSAQHIMHISESTQGNSLWLSTKGSGVIEWDPKGVIRSNYSIAQGLPSNRINAIYQDSMGWLWVSTPSNIVRIEQQPLNITVYKEPASALNPEYYTKASFRSKSGKIYFGSMNGIYAVDPSRIHQSQTKAASLAPKQCVISSVQFQNMKTGEWESLTLSESQIEAPSDAMILRVDFTHFPSVLQPKPKFSYQISNLSNRWVILSEKSIKLNFLPYGTHELLIRSQNKLLNWGKPIRLSITIPPPFYLQGWFIGICATVLILIGYATYQWRLQRFRQRELALEMQVAERTAKIEKQTQELKELNEAQSRFFANISHELRTPLTLIFSPVEDLIEKAELYKPEQIRERLKIVQKNSLQLLEMIGEILDLSKFDKGKVKAQLEPCLLSELCQDIIAPFQEEALYRKRHVALDFQLPANMRYSIDIGKTKKIINNLILNAIKYSTEGDSIRFTVKESPLRLLLIVQDSGIGISEEDLPYIFERFYQADRAKQSEGVGIGLAFAKELAELLDGSLSAESKLGEGSRFTLAIPKVELTKATSGGRPPAESSNTSSLATKPIAEGAQILIAEDNPELLDFISGILADSYEISTATNGLEAWEAIQGKKQEFTLIISDIMMPKLDGFGLLERVRQNEELNVIPFLFLTALSSSQHRIKGFKTGVDDYLTKPFLPNELRVRVNNLLSRFESRREFFMQLQEDDKQDSMPPNIPQTNPQKQVTKEDWDWIDQVEQTLRKEASNSSFTIEDLADLNNISYRQFNRRLKSITGLSPSQYQREIKLQMARELFEETNDTLSQVAGKLGFKKGSYLSKLFSERFGIHHSELKRRH